MVDENNSKDNEIIPKNKEDKPKIIKKEEIDQYPTLKLKSERDIAMDFAEKVYIKFDKLVKSVIFFGSAAKKENVEG
jgi:hypothetical protein